MDAVVIVFYRENSEIENSNIDYVSSEIMQQQENFRKDFNAVTSKQI